MSRPIQQVGAPDATRETSPIVEEQEDEELALAAEPEGCACWFNGERFSLGDYVVSGDELLRCEEGSWVRKGEMVPERDIGTR